jgi:NTP pyrophosphatase (non-canonical NTP hydrolase)
MARVGGYWRPLAAVARLLEELGELAELLASPARDDAELASELADLWIITTALADQFLADVAEPGAHATGARGATIGGSAPADTRGGELAPLLLAAAQIARIVNYYDGPKTPRSLDGWPSLSEAVAELHRLLAELALAHDVELGAAVSDKLRTIATRDARRFARAEHDPSSAPCLERFRRAQAQIRGADAGAERLWGAPAWSAQPAAANVATIVPSLSAFTRAAARERIDGYVIAGPVLESAELAVDWAQAVLGELVPSGPASGEDRAAGAPFTFAGVPLSADVLAAAHPYIVLRRAGSNKDHR